MTDYTINLKGALFVTARNEYPRPQFERENWMNLNGTWQFEIDQSRSGEARGLAKAGTPLAGEIQVPFAPESKLSGIGNTDFMLGVWYKRIVTLPESDRRTVLHFGAVDYRTTVFVNGKRVGTHQGGYVSFSFDISEYVKTGENEITVFAEDDTRDERIPTGKQCPLYDSFGCFYTRTTGIWQTVWLEFTEQTYIDRVRYYPNYQDGSINIEADLFGQGDFSATVTYNGKEMGTYFCQNAADRLSFHIDLQEKHLWEIGNGRLYDIVFRFGKDTVKSYFGLREVALSGKKFLLNGKSIFQRLVLDQGFYPDGIYTAPTDEALKNDILLSINAGFNGARLHQKVFEERFLYHADRMGYLVWGEYPSWGIDISRSDGLEFVAGEWMEELNRDFNHPSIIGWCPFNETFDFNGKRQHDETIRLIYEMTKAIDNTRPCIDTSGNFHVKTDIFCVHDYEQQPDVFKRTYDKLMETGELVDRFSDRQTYRGEPIFVSEYGGIGWTEDKNGWGYGNVPQSLDEFYVRLKGLTSALLDNDQLFGFCYTQLTDVEQEQNGIYHYDRSEKFDMERICAIFSRKAKSE